MRKLVCLVSVVVLLAVIAGAACADGWPRANTYKYTRELFTGSFPVVSNTVQLVLVRNAVVGDRISVDESKIYIPAGVRVRFHVTSLDSNYLLKIKNAGNAEPLLEVAVSGRGEGAGTLTRGLGPKETRDLVILKGGRYLVGSGVKVVPEG